MNESVLSNDRSMLVPRTEGIKYAGSKMKLLPYIFEMVEKTKAKTILDGFAGTTRVSQALAKRGYKVICNDIAVWSKVFGTCYLLNKYSKNEYKELIDHLNIIPAKDGWFTENYGGEPNDGTSTQVDGLKKPWQKHNTRRLDAIREEIANMSLEPIKESVLLTSLILALDEVDSTLGHYAAYLKEWSPRSYKTLHLKIPNLFINRLEHQVFQKDIFELLPQVQTDLAYYDPPYGSNNEKMPPSRVRYASYYHLWTSICLYDKPKLFGKSKRREDTSDTLSSSIFEEFRRDENGCYVVVNAIDRLLSLTNSRWILLSYSSGGRATANELNQIITKHGRIVDIMEIDYKKNVMAGMKWTNEWVRDADAPNKEFLFLIEK